MNDQVLAMNQLLLYRDKVDSFRTPLAQAAILKTNLGKKEFRLYSFNGGLIREVVHLNFKALLSKF
ncbi:hypothetical protein EPI10_024833 [Gossypium australe]|uniref:Uncharacterized protein n=1 Tax=Gossypium australe TaxID=47621 RepID=A0A5B6VY43_9ROSI|nr:hypothetical protein EPI10_024833 [Gossypium australe]